MCDILLSFTLTIRFVLNVPREKKSCDTSICMNILQGQLHWWFLYKIIIYGHKLSPISLVKFQLHNKNHYAYIFSREDWIHLHPPLVCHCYNVLMIFFSFLSRTRRRLLEPQLKLISTTRVHRDLVSKTKPRVLITAMRHVAAKLIPRVVWRIELHARACTANDNNDFVIISRRIAKISPLRTITKTHKRER